MEPQSIEELINWVVLSIFVGLFGMIIFDFFFANELAKADEGVEYMMQNRREEPFDHLPVNPPAPNPDAPTESS